MESCQLCASVVRELHPIPPEIKTREVIEALDDSRSVGDLELCADCIDGLMSGTPTAELAAPGDAPR